MTIYSFEPSRMVKPESKQVNFNQAPTWETLVCSEKLVCK